jgi:hypothetical protein
LGATVIYASPRWSSLRIARVPINLFLNSEHLAAKVGLHFVVSNLAAARAAIERAVASSAGPSTEAAPGTIIVGANDTEDNTFTLRQVEKNSGLLERR